MHPQSGVFSDEETETTCHDKKEYVGIYPKESEVVCNSESKYNVKSTPTNIGFSIGCSGNKKKPVVLNDDTRVRCTDDQLFRACSNALGLSTEGDVGCPKKPGVYEVSHYVDLKRNLGDLKKHGMKTCIPHDYFKRVWLKNYCKGKGGYMSPGKFNHIVSCGVKRAANVRVFPCDGYVTNVTHNFPFGLGVKIDGLQAYDSANCNPTSLDGGKNTAVDGVYVPENTRGFRRSVGDGYCEEDLNQRISMLKNFSGDQISKHVQPLHAKNCHVLNIESSVFDYLKSNPNKYGIKSEQLVPDRNNEIRLDNETAKAIIDDLSGMVKKVKSFDTINIDVRPHTRNRSWNDLAALLKERTLETNESYKPSHHDLLYNKKQYGLQLKLVFCVKIV